MLELTTFIAKLGDMVDRATQRLENIREARREKQAKYLDNISETLASAGVVANAGGNITRQVAELRYHLASIEEVLRLGGGLMEVTDDCVVRLRSELEIALKKTPLHIIAGQKELEIALKETSQNCLSGQNKQELPDFAEREKLVAAFLLASGVFRGAAVTLRGKI